MNVEQGKPKGECCEIRQEVGLILTIRSAVLQNHCALVENELEEHGCWLSSLGERLMMAAVGSNFRDI